MKTKGTTLVELVVAMGIFTILSTMAVGAFVTVSRMKTMSASMRETQQKTRVAMETISRLARQADTVLVTDDTIQMFFNTTTSNPSAYKYAIENRSVGQEAEQWKLYYYECDALVAPYHTCDHWAPPG